MFSVKDIKICYDIYNIFWCGRQRTILFCVVFDIFKNIYIWYIYRYMVYFCLYINKVSYSHHCICDEKLGNVYIWGNLKNFGNRIYMNDMVKR